MGRPDAEYWDLTYREIDACQQAWLAEQDVVNARFGTIAATILNAQRTEKSQRVWAPEDFFRPLTAGKPTTAQTADQIGAAFDWITAAIHAQRTPPNA